MLPSVAHHLGNLGLGYLKNEHAAHSLTLCVYLKHHACGRGAILPEDPFEHVDDELHRSVIVIEQNHLIERRLFDLGLVLLDDETAFAICPLRFAHNPLTAMAAAATGARYSRHTFIGFAAGARKGGASRRPDRFPAHTRPVVAQNSAPQPDRCAGRAVSPEAARSAPLSSASDAMAARTLAR